MDETKHKNAPLSGATLTVAALTGLAVGSLMQNGARAAWRPDMSPEEAREWGDRALAQSQQISEAYRRAEQDEATQRHQTSKAILRRLREAGATKAVYHLMTDVAGYTRHDCTRDTEAEAEAEGEAWLDEQALLDPDGAEEYDYWVEREDVPVKTMPTIRGPKLHPQISKFEDEQEEQAEKIAYENFLSRLPR